MTYQYSFKDCLQRAERITWRVEDLIGRGKTLDFEKPFLPETLARTKDLDFLGAREQLVLNQIRGHAYLSMFGLVEEFILPFLLGHAQPYMTGDDYRTRALLEFMSEEAKHIHLFRCFKAEFQAGFSTPCGMIGPAEAIKQHVFKHPPLSVALLTLHLEWMTQRHFLESVEADEDLDPQFKSLLRHHWMEEHQHAQLDALLIELLARDMSTAEIEAAIDGYEALGAFFDAGLERQTELDMEALQITVGRILGPDERARFLRVQH